MSSLPIVQPGGLPYIDRPLDNTALQAYMACPREYWYGMVLHRRAEGGRSPALSFGGAIHKLLELHYRGMPAEMCEALTAQWWEKNGHSEEGDHRTFDRALLDFKRYREKWGKVPQDEQGRTIGFPDEPMVEISADIMAGGLVHPYAVKIDRIIDLGGQIFIEDHKTTSRLDKNYYASFELSQQMMGYVYVAQALFPSLKIVGMRLNVIHILKDKTNFERQLFSWTREQIAEWESNTNAWMQRISNESQVWTETLPTEGFNEPLPYWPVAHYGDNGCARKYGLCQYHRLCSVAAPFRHRLLSDLPINPWNPLDVDD